MSELPAGDRIDRWLRRGLDVDPATGARLAAAALERPEASLGRLVARRLSIVAAIAAIVVVVAIALLRGGPEPVATTTAVETVRITNFGDLVAVMDPSGGARLRNPPRRVSASSPRLIIRLGEQDGR